MSHRCFFHDLGHCTLIPREGPPTTMLGTPVNGPPAASLSFFVVCFILIFLVLAGIGRVAFRQGRKSLGGTTLSGRPPQAEADAAGPGRRVTACASGRWFLAPCHSGTRQGSKVTITVCTRRLPEPGERGLHAVSDFRGLLRQVMPTETVATCIEACWGRTEFSTTIKGHPPWWCSGWDCEV